MDTLGRGNRRRIHDNFHDVILAAHRVGIDGEAVVVVGLVLADAVTAHLGVNAVGVAEHRKRAVDVAVEADRRTVIDKIGVGSGEAALLLFLLLRLAVLILLRRISLRVLIVILMVVLVVVLVVILVLVIILFLHHA